MEYNSNFGTLVKQKEKYPLDGFPLVAGIACLLKQFHPSTTKHLLSYLGQFIRSTIQTAYNELEANNKVIDLPKEVVNTLIFLNHLCQYSDLPRSAIYTFIPPYIFDSIKIFCYDSRKL